MVIGLLTIDLQVPASESLKDKRQVIRSVVTRLRQEYNISVAEIDHLDSWQLSTLAVACVSAEAIHAQQMMQQVVSAIQGRAVEYVVLDVQTELL